MRPEGSEWTGRAPRAIRLGNVAATVALLSLPLSFVCFLAFRVLATVRPYPFTRFDEVLIGTLANAGGALCFAALIVGALALLLGTEHKARAITGIVGFLPALFLGYLLLLPSAL